MSYKVKFIDGVGGIESLKSSWQELFLRSASGNYFLSFEWIEMWTKTFADERLIRLIYCEIDTEIVAIAPLVFENGNLASLIDSQTADYTGILYDPDHPNSAKAIVDSILGDGCWKKLTLGPIPSRSNQHWVDYLCSKADFTDLQNNCPHLFLETIGDSDEYFKGRAKKLRQEIRTTVNKLERLGSWKFEIAKDTEATKKMYSALEKFHLVRQSGKPGKSTFASAQRSNFYKNLATQHFDEASNERTNVPHLSAIVSNGEIVSAAYGLVCNGTYLYWITSFNDALKIGSLGKLHIELLIKMCFETQHIKMFDFTGGSEKYKYQWTEDHDTLITCVAFSGPVRFKLYQMRQRLIRIARTAKSKSKFLAWLWTKVSKVIFD